MRPDTDRLPKCLLPVADRPFADWQLEWLAREGVDEVVYCIGYRGDLVREHVGDGRRFGLTVDYVDEGDHPLGTAGALRLAAEAGALDPAFWVLYGDSFLSVSLAAVEGQYVQQGAPVLMTVYRDLDHLDAPNAVFGQGMVTNYEKGLSSPPADMVYVDYGLSRWLRWVVEDRVPARTPVDLAELFTDLSRAGLLSGYEVADRFHEIGSPAGRQELDTWLRNNHAVGAEPTDPRPT